MKRIALFICLAGLIPILPAANLPTGTWVRRPIAGGSATMIVEAAGAGQKYTFRVQVAGGGFSTMILTTQYDGKDAEVLVDGKPSGETMAIRMLDDHHVINILKMNGNPMVTQKSELSADGKTIKTESVSSVPGVQNPVEYWDKK